MKNEGDRAKDKSKISILKKKLTTAAAETEETEKKARKDKKIKGRIVQERGGGGGEEEEVEDYAATKSHKSLFGRKFNFGKYMNPSTIPRTSSSKSMSESSGYSTLTSTTCSMEGVNAAILPAPTPGAIERTAGDIIGVNVASTSFVPVSPSTDHEFDSTNTNPTTIVDNITAKSDNKSVIATPAPPDSSNSDFHLKDINNSNGNNFIIDKSHNSDPEKQTKTTGTTGKSRPETAGAMPAFGNLTMDLIKDRPDAPDASNAPDITAQSTTTITRNVDRSVDGRQVNVTAERKEHLYKILVIGELGTGKTSIIKRYVHQFFSQHYRATIGVDFALKVLNWDANTIIRLQLWDIAGQERFGNMTRVYYKDAVGAFIVFDVTRAATFDAVDKWKQDLDSKVQLPDGSPIPCVLIGNKCDQQKEGIVNTPNRMDEYCRDKGFSGWFETSAKENINIEDAARFLVNKILLNDKLLNNDANKDSDRIAIDDKGNNGSNHKKTCSC